MHPKNERTFVILKPDAIQRGLMGEILGRFERVGLKFVAMKLVVAKEEQCWTHYNKSDEWYTQKGQRYVDNITSSGGTPEKPAIEYGKDIVRSLVKYMTASPVLAFILEGNKAAMVVTKLVGETEPATSDIGTIRGDFTVDSYELANLGRRAVRNLVHCSESPEEAEREIKIWFTEEELIKYRHMQDAMLYDVNMDGILE